MTGFALYFCDFFARPHAGTHLRRRANSAIDASVALRQGPRTLVVQYVAAPLSGNVADEVKARYSYLRKFGPNDGLTLLADELLPGGVTVIEPELDHFYRDPEINLKSLAIANFVADELNARPAIQK